MRHRRSFVIAFASLALAAPLPALAAPTITIGAAGVMGVYSAGRRDLPHGHRVQRNLAM
jgi:hypothetical protein